MNINVPSHKVTSSQDKGTEKMLTIMLSFVVVDNEEEEEEESIDPSLVFNVYSTLKIKSG